MSAIVVVTALRLESRAVLAALGGPRRVRGASRPTWTGHAAGREVVVVQGGVGPDAARAATAAVPAEAALLGSVGVVGALAPGLAPGDVIIPTAVVWEGGGAAGRYDVAPALVAAMLAALAPALPRPARAGVLLSSPSIVVAVDAKRAAYDRHAALAVEMEAAALAAYATERGVPFFAVRVVLDPADLSLEDLPPNLDASWAARARLATMPAVWPLLGALRRHATTAGTALTGALRIALPALAGTLARDEDGPYSRRLTER